MNDWKIFVEGIALFAPGLNGWSQAREVLSGRNSLTEEPLALPVVESLPPAERRRIGLPVKLAMALGYEATADAGIAPGTLPSVFSSSAGDGENCHQILQSLASEDRSISPTRFHNSVHNATAGYWTIATACMEPSTSLGAGDASFSAGLVEAACMAHSTGKPCLLVAMDSPYPEPLRSKRPIGLAFGVGLVLGSVKSSASKAQLVITTTQQEPLKMPSPELEKMRSNVPAARSLPLLQALALGASQSVVIEYLDGLHLQLDIEP